MPSFFNSSILPKCRDRFIKASKSLHDCRSAKTFPQFYSHWSEFLIHTGGILNALDTGARHTPQAKQWYAGVKRKGRADQLVNYMHQARNAEEHAAEETSRLDRGSIMIGVHGEPVHITEMVTGPELFYNPEEYLKGRAFNPQSGEQASIVTTGDGPVLRAIEFRGVNTPPPTEHNGEKLRNTNPLHLGELYLLYLEGLITKAHSLS